MALRTHQILSKVVVNTLKFLCEFDTSAKFWSDTQKSEISSELYIAHFSHGFNYEYAISTRFVITCSRMDFQNELQIISSHRWKSTIFSAFLQAINAAKFPRAINAAH